VPAGAPASPVVLLRWWGEPFSVLCNNPQRDECFGNLVEYIYFSGTLLMLYVFRAPFHPYPPSRDFLYRIDFQGFATIRWKFHFLID